PHLRTLSHEQVTRLCGGFLDDLATVLWSVAAARGSVTDWQTQRFSLFEGLAVLLNNLAMKAPVVAVLDDIHFADASAWEVLKYLSRSLREARLLVIASGRPAELAEDEVGTEVLHALEQE